MKAFFQIIIAIPQKSKVAKVEKSEPTKISKKYHFSKQQICQNDGSNTHFVLLNQFLV